MHLSLNFARSILPCVMTGLQALSPVTATEPVAFTQEPTIVQMAANVHSQPNAQITYAEWKKRLQEAKSEVVIQTHEMASLNNQVASAAPALNHG